MRLSELSILQIVDDDCALNPMCRIKITSSSKEILSVVTATKTTTCLTDNVCFENLS